MGVLSLGPQEETRVSPDGRRRRLQYVSSVAADAGTDKRKIAKHQFFFEADVFRAGHLKVARTF